MAFPGLSGERGGPLEKRSGFRKDAKLHGAHTEGEGTQIVAVGGVFPAGVGPAQHSSAPCSLLAGGLALAFSHLLALVLVEGDALPGSLLLPDSGLLVWTLPFCLSREQSRKSPCWCRESRPQGFSWGLETPSAQVLSLGGDPWTRSSGPCSRLCFPGAVGRNVSREARQPSGPAAQCQSQQIPCCSAVASS